MWVDYLEISVNVGVTKEIIYDIFSEPYIKGDLFIVNLISAFYKDEYRSYYLLNSELINRSVINPRWIDLFMKQLDKKWNDDDSRLLYFIAAYDPTSSKLVKILDKCLDKFKISDFPFSTVALSILSLNNVKMTDKLINRIMEDIIKGGVKYFQYYNMWNVINKIPQIYLGQFVALAETD